MNTPEHTQTKDIISPANPWAQLEDDFKNPPDVSRPYTWFHKMESHISKDGITRDLEAMKAAGLGGFQMFDIGLKYPQGPVKYNSPEWRDTVDHTRKVAERLGLDMGMMNGAGWSSTGGPWITPENSMKTTVWREQVLGDSDQDAITLAVPELSAKQQKYDFYRDICVIAFPTPEPTDSGEIAKLANWQTKALVGIDKNDDQLMLPETNDLPASLCVASDKVIDITKYLDKDNLLTWSKPSGSWTVIRFGYTTTCTHNKHPADGGLGLECDKLDRTAVDAHWEALLEPIIKDTVGSKTFSNILIDSFEVSVQNWTAGFETLFREHNGYDITCYLPCLTGRVVDSCEVSERFLWDFRSTVVHLFEKNYFTYFKERCHEHGLKFACETYGNGTFDSPSASLIPDIPMTEFWHMDQDRTLWNWTNHIICSAAHLGGKTIAGGESFTCMSGNWTHHPYAMKKQGDNAFCRGMNRIYFHTFIHQPWHVDVKPGMTMGRYGISINRNDTWYLKVRDWFDYLARCQHISQLGTYLADILVLYGDDRSLNNIHGLGEDKLDLTLLPGFNFDAGGASTIAALEVDDSCNIRIRKDGKLLATRYKVLVIKRSSLLREELVAKLGAIADKGARVIAERPVRTPTLRNYPETEPRLQKLLSLYWDSGKIQAEVSLESTLAKIGKDIDGPASLDFAHFKIDGGDFYFVTNTKEETLRAEVSFRIQGKTPELWNPETAEVCKAPNWQTTDNCYTKVTLDLASLGSVFVVFRKETTAKGLKTPAAKSQLDFSLDKDWEVSFDPKWGPKNKVHFNSLAPWNESDSEDIKYYSGSAIYRKEFAYGAIPTGAHVYLDLGIVHLMAGVTLNGRKIRTLWKPDYSLEISDFLEKGTNLLEIEVTNLWPNRLIGDEHHPDYELSSKPGLTETYPDWLLAGNPPPAGPRRAYATFKHWTKDDELLPSGLIGPVRILSCHQA